MGQVIQRQNRGFKVFGVDPDPYAGARFAVTLTRFAYVQGFSDIAGFKHQPRD